MRGDEQGPNGSLRRQVGNVQVGLLRRLKLRRHVKKQHCFQSQTCYKVFPDCHDMRTSREREIRQYGDSELNGASQEGKGKSLRHMGRIEVFENLV